VIKDMALIGMAPPMIKTVPGTGGTVSVAQVIVPVSEETLKKKEF
jgi:hypothetical protein